MFAILKSGIWTLLSWVMRAVIVKFVLYTALYLFVSEAVKYMSDKILVDTSSISSAFSGLVDGSGYFLKLAKVDVGLPMILSATLLRFIIRRIPLIG